MNKENIVLDVYKKNCRNENYSRVWNLLLFQIMQKIFPKKKKKNDRNIHAHRFYTSECIDILFWTMRVSVVTGQERTRERIRRYPLKQRRRICHRELASSHVKFMAHNAPMADSGQKFRHLLAIYLPGFPTRDDTSSDRKNDFLVLSNNKIRGVALLPG